MATESFFSNASLAYLASAGAGKDGKTYSIKPSDGTGDFTFSRGSNLAATRVGPTGLIEKGRENLLLQSNQFDTTPWGTPDSDVTIGQIGYDGSNNAWLLSKTATNGRVQQNISISGVDTFSIYAKANTKNWMALRVDGSGVNTYFDLQNGVLGSSANTIEANIESVGNGWYRCSVSFSSTITRVRIYVSDANNDTSGTSGSIYIQDAQLEIGLAATDYIESGATTGKAGLLEDEPRFDYSGGATCPSLLLEPSRTQLITQSEYFGSWGNAAASIVSNYSTSPEGSKNAYLVYPASDGSYRDKTLQVTGASGYYTFSCFIKSSGKRWAYFRNYFASNIAVHFDLQNGVVGTEQSGYTGKIESYGNGWYRCSMSSNFTGSNPWGVVGVSDADNSPAVLVNGTDGILVYGAQMEQASYPTSYIPNHSGGTITRGADFNSNNDIISTPISFGANDDFTLYYEGSFDKSGSQGMIMGGGIVGAAADTKGYWWVRSSDLYLAGDAETTIATASFSVVANTNYKLLVKRNGSVLDFFANGTKLTTNQVNPNTGFTFRSLGWSYSNAVYKISGDIKQALIFPDALSDADCIALTS